MIDDKKLTEIRVRIPVSAARAMAMHSKKYEGVKRPNQGSIAHFLRSAALRALKHDFECDMYKISQKIIKIPKIIIDKP